MNVLERDFFTDPEMLQDPIPYYVALRERGPVWREPHKGVFMLSGIEEILEVYTDHERFSAIVAPLGPLVKLPQPAEGESWAEVIERRRHEIPMGDQLMTFDPPKHTRHRALVGRLFTPNRLKENEEFMWTLADELIDEFADRGEVEFCRRLREALHPARDRRPARGPARRPRDVPRLARGPAGQRRRPRRAGTSAIRCSRTCIPTSPATSRSAAPRRATTS